MDLGTKLVVTKSSCEFALRPTRGSGHAVDEPENAQKSNREHDHSPAVLWTFVEPVHRQPSGPRCSSGQLSGSNGWALGGGSPGENSYRGLARTLRRHVNLTRSALSRTTCIAASFRCWLVSPARMRAECVLANYTLE